MPSAVMVAGDGLPRQLPRYVAMLDSEVKAEYDRQLHLAKCRDMDPDLFHPVPKEGHRAVVPARVEADAKYACAGCPIKAVCLEYGLRLQAKFPKEEGIYGGTGKYVRKKILAKRAEAVPS